MRHLKWILSSIFVLIIVLVYILYPTDEKKIKKVINNGEKAIEAEDIDGLMKYISYNYLDDYGNGYLQIKTIFQRVFKHLNDIEIERDALRITVNNDRAEAEFNVRVIASEGQDRGYILGDAGRAQNIKVYLEKSLNKWLIMRVEGVREGTMQEKDIQVIEKFKLLVSQKVKILELRVFGSRARGDAGPESDLDVLVVVDQLDRSIEKYISECAWEAGFYEDVLIMPVAVSIDVVKHSPLSESIFIKNVYREGVAV